MHQFQSELLQLRLSRSNELVLLSSGVQSLTRSSLKGGLKQSPFCLQKWGVLQATCPLSGIGLYKRKLPPKNANLSAKSPSSKPLLTQTSSVFPLPRIGRVALVSCVLLLLIGNQQTQLSRTQFDKTTARYEYWEVLSPPLCLFEGVYVYIYIYILYVVSLAAILRNWATIGSTSSQRWAHPQLGYRCVSI